VIRREPLARLVLPAALRPDRPELDRVTVGRREDGRPWLLPIRGGHILVAGATGAGKGSVIQSIIRGLAPAIRAGLVHLLAVDPKGGMELAFGRPLYRQFATTPEKIAEVLETAVETLNDRTARLAGRTRLLTPPGPIR
jgi:S-DNA-T family DNA segregation ATPase FtsK/SpoIIIE